MPVIRLIGAEMFKLRKRSMTNILLYILIGIMVVLYFVLLAISKVNLPTNAGVRAGTIQNLLGLPIALPFTMNILAYFGCVLAIVLVASCVGSEYNWRTMRSAVVSSESRFKLLTAKLISCAVFILIGMVVGLAVGFIMSLITTAIGGYKFDFSFMTGGYLWDQFLQFWRTFFVIIPYALLSFMFAILGRSAMPGIASGIGIFFLEQFIVSFMYLAKGWIAKIPDYLLYANQQAITSLANLPKGFTGGGGPGGGGFTIVLPSVTHAFIALIIYSLAFLFISFWLFKKRDVTG
jgi:ABC-type transport system involved in multi-copper enzyme maturation permease subunit